MAQDRNASTGALLAGPGLGSPTFNFHHGSADSSDPSIQYNQCIINQVEASGVTNLPRSCTAAINILMGVHTQMKRFAIPVIGIALLFFTAEFGGATAALAQFESANLTNAASQAAERRSGQF